MWKGESVQDDPNEVVIQVGFAENYSTVNQDEIQQAYFGHGHVTLFSLSLGAEKYHTLNGSGI